ncbi:NAD-dependent epimerase/dehydratase family protein [Candidatus Latescibacterota bacterium]
MVYGKTEGRETPGEDADLILGEGDQPGWDYAFSKIANEHLAQAHVARHGLRATIVRLFNVIGPRAKGQVIPIFLGQARARVPLTVHGDGGHRRCFTDVRDIAEAFVRLAHCDDACNDVVNIGSRNEYSLLQLADLAKSATHSDSPVSHIPFEHLPMGEYQRHHPWKTPSLSKARKLIGYAAVHPIDECLREIVALDDNPGLA